MTNSGACIGLSPAPLPAAMLRGAAHDASEMRGRRFAVRFALYGRRTCAPTSGWRGWSFRVDATVEETAAPNGNPRVFLVNTLFWKILVTRVNRKISRVEYGGNGRSNRAAGCCGSRRKGGAPSSGPTCAMLSLKWVAVGTIRDSGTRKLL